ncbi:SDR family NAD(P)-dependent oxidoreductase [Demequina sp. NBRC 110055]|uniref:SDR family NAD(P)-dependent oxidoreductase n=1 Tax=Demequina sp. NBRC 110055 TaxID=1570344 RepID=UPI0009FD2C51|nr:SDR family NAD(P)-dependent oxidoreductase [Demequina sp. NBRC 110055]
MTTPPVTTISRLTGRKAIVTGGARGIGAAIASRLAAEGAKVVILDRLESESAATAAACGGRAVTVNLADAMDTALAMDEAIAAAGGVDILVNCAGIFAKTPLLDITSESWDAMLDINARATLITMQRAAAAMIAAGGGTIINMASMAAKKGGGLEGHYAASKAAVVALTRAAAEEWGAHAIRANAVCPGYVLTEMGADTRSAEQVAGWSQMSPLGRLARPSDVADLVAFLASDESSYMTGQAVNLTGGMVMH